MSRTEAPVTRTREDPARPAEGSDRRLSLPWRAYAAVRSALLTVAAVVGAVSIVVFGISVLFGIKPLVVVSGSMEPTIPVGSIVFSEPVRASQPTPGDIVTVQRPRGLGLITHRLVASHEVQAGVYQYTLRGDANTTNDPEPYLVKTAGLYKGHAIWVGYLAFFLQSRFGQAVALAAALALIAVFLLDPARISPAGRTRRPWS